MAKEQVCSTEACGKQAEFTTRSKPAWCTDCLTGILAGLDLVPLVDFPGPKGWWLTRCSSCGAECHYRLELLLEKRRTRETACGRCNWDSLAVTANAYGGAQPFGVNKLRALMDRNGFDPVEQLVALPSGNHPVITKCRDCGRQQAQRPCDIGWGCNCTQNTKSNSPAAARPAAGKTKNLLIDSDSPALKWWDRAANSEADLQTATLRARREVGWVCPDCDHRFTARVYEMVDRTKCPVCAEIRHAEWLAEYERLKNTPITSVPELLADWADEYDPGLVMVASRGLCRFECANGHHPRISPFTYLQNGCPSCRAQATAADSRQTLRTELPEIAGQWHPTKNGVKYTPDTVGPDSKRTVWWLADCCGHEWEETVRNRNKYKRQRCPQCRTILDSLA